MFDSKTIQKLNTKLDPSLVKFRQQAGRDLAYIDGYTAISHANEVFGYDGWSSAVKDLNQVYLQFDETRKKWVCVYTATVMVETHNEEGGINSHIDVGTGQGVMSTVSDAIESAIKEAVTDAVKRTLRYWGPQFGLDLYSETEREEQGLTSKARQTPQPANKPAAAPVPQSNPDSRTALANQLNQMVQGLKGDSAKLQRMVAKMHEVKTQHNVSKVSEAPESALRQLIDFAQSLA